jgi:transcriptional repressor NrdR
MRCPFCSAEDTRVIESRANDEAGTIRRRRECQDCRRRFTTYERSEELPFYVVKKDGRREPFQQLKLMEGLTKACEKRPISRETIEQVASDIERELRDALKDEVPSAYVGDRVMARLRDLDEVAYVRFASVYKEFRDLATFLQEIESAIARSARQRATEEQHALFAD